LIIARAATEAPRWFWRGTNHGGRRRGGRG